MSLILSKSKMKKMKAKYKKSEKKERESIMDETRERDKERVDFPARAGN